MTSRLNACPNSVGNCRCFLVGQAVSPVTAGCSRRLVAAMPACGAGWNPARQLATGAVRPVLQASAGGLPTRRRFPTCPTSRHGLGLNTDRLYYAIILLESYQWKPHGSLPRARSFCPKRYALPEPGDRALSLRSKKPGTEFCCVPPEVFPKPLLTRSPAVYGPHGNRKRPRRWAPLSDER